MEKDYFIRQLTSGFVVEDAAGAPMETPRSRHAFTDLDEALAFLKGQYVKPKKAPK